MAATAPYTRLLDPLRLRYLDSPLPGWVRAGADAVRELLPVAWRRQLGGGMRRLWLRPQGADLVLERQLDDVREPVGVLEPDELELRELLQVRMSAAGAAQRWLLLDNGQVLRRVLTLPLAAEPRLREVLAHEVDRQTPFATDQVCFEARVLDRDVAARQLRAELVVLPRVRLEAALERLGPLAEGLAGVDVRDVDGRALGLNLLPPSMRHVAVDRARQLNLMLAAIAVVALLGAMVLMLANRRAALVELQARVDAVDKDVREVRRLRNSLQSRQEAASFLARTRKVQPTMLELLADLTRRIPDDTSLEKVSVSEGRIVLIGQSRQAPALVGLLQDSTLIHSPALAGAVQKDPRTNLDRFTLTGTVAGSPADLARKDEDAP
jgi:general secretion pathway protein L